MKQKLRMKGIKNQEIWKFKSWKLEKSLNKDTNQNKTLGKHKLQLEKITDMEGNESREKQSHEIIKRKGTKP